MDGGRIIDSKGDYTWSPHKVDPDLALRLALPGLFLPVKGLLTHIPGLSPERIANKVPRAILHKTEHLINLIENNLTLNFLFLMFSL